MTIGKRRRNLFALSMIWYEPINYFENYYFCPTKLLGFSRNSKHRTEYPYVMYGLMPMLHAQDLPITSK
jgi:hypothetical protein